MDVLQVGTRNALNYSLLKEIGRLSAGTDSTVLLKRGRHVASPNELIAAAEYIVAEGNPNVMLCPRGTTPLSMDIVITGRVYLTTFEKQNLGTGGRDPSHSVGHCDYVKACSLAAIAYGADGLCIEAHIDPAKGNRG